MGEKKDAACGNSLVLRQGSTSSHDIEKSSYLRLGSYVAGLQEGDSEINVVTTLSTTTSQTQSNDGILIYTDCDLQERVLAGTQAKYGNGHAVEISAANASHHVSRGSYELSASQGITITTDISETVYQHAINVATHRDIITDPHLANPDIQITATGFINQNAGSDFRRTVSGATTEVSHGLSTRIFHKIKTEIHAGFRNCLTVGCHTNIACGAELRMKVGMAFELSLLGFLKINIGPEIEIHSNRQSDVFFHGKTDLVTGQVNDTTYREYQCSVWNDFSVDVVGDLKLKSDGPINDLVRNHLSYRTASFRFIGDIHNTRVSGTYYLSTFAESETATLKTEDYNSFQRHSTTFTDIHTFQVDDARRKILSIKNIMAMA